VVEPSRIASATRAVTRASRSVKGPRRTIAAALLTNAPGNADDSGSVADRTVVLVLVVLRAGTLALGAAESVASSSLTHPGVVAAVLAGLLVESAIVWGRVALRLRRSTPPILDRWAVLTEGTAGVAALILLAYATPPALRTSSTFWVEPYTVITAVVLAAAAARLAILAGAATICMTAAYLVCELAWRQGRTSLSTSARATAWTNALSYLPFFAIGAVAFALVRAIVGQTEVLQRMLIRLTAERARVAAASSAYRIGHDIPKALLREVRRGAMGAEQLRPWAAKYRDDLLAALTIGDQTEVRFADELASLVPAFVVAMELHVDIAGVGDPPPGAPVLLIVEAVRELLNNASYHAYGYPVTLCARSSQSAVQVAVRNDGPGVDQRLLASTWARKQNTLHQLGAAGGSYRIVSSVGSTEGTTITLTWPATRGEFAPTTM
jgi:hypothetical protein